MTDKARFYETLYLVRPDIEDAELNSIKGKFASALSENRGETIRDEKWAERELAYEIVGYKRGTYHIMVYKALPPVVAALEKQMGLHKADILRFMTVTVDEDRAHAKEPEKTAAPASPGTEPSTAENSSGSRTEEPPPANTSEADVANDGVTAPEKTDTEKAP